MDEEHQLGDAPVEDQYKGFMNGLASGIDQILNGNDKGSDRRTGFVLMIFPFGTEPGRCNYVSNAQRGDIIKLLKEQVKHFEKQRKQKTRLR
jgi:hypothetical protein